MIYARLVWLFVVSEGDRISVAGVVYKSGLKLGGEILPFTAHLPSSGPMGASGACL